MYPRGKYSRSPGSSTSSKTGGDGKSASVKFTAQMKIHNTTTTSTDYLMTQNSLQEPVPEKYSLRTSYN